MIRLKTPTEAVAAPCTATHVSSVRDQEDNHGYGVIVREAMVLAVENRATDSMALAAPPRRCHRGKRVVTRHVTTEVGDVQRICHTPVAPTSPG